MNASDSRTVGRSDRLRRRAHVLAALVLAFQSIGPTVRLSAQLSPHDSAVHALDRLAYGPRPGEVDAVAAGGVMNWIDRQLSPDQVDDRLVATRAATFRILRYDSGDLARLYAAASEERRGRPRPRARQPPLGRPAPPPQQGGKGGQKGRPPGGGGGRAPLVACPPPCASLVRPWPLRAGVFAGAGAGRLPAATRPRADAQGDQRKLRA